MESRPPSNDSKMRPRVAPKVTSGFKRGILKWTCRLNDLVWTQYIIKFFNELATCLGCPNRLKTFLPYLITSYWGRQCSWTLTSAKSKQVLSKLFKARNASNMWQNDCNAKTVQICKWWNDKSSYIREKIWTRYTKRSLKKPRPHQHLRRQLHHQKHDNDESNAGP